jgi:predicted O-methyltransferase YrrM
VLLFLRKAKRSLVWLMRLLAIWCSPNRRFLAYPPGHYYSPLPSVSEIAKDELRIFGDPPSIEGMDLNLPFQWDWVVGSADGLRNIAWPKERDPDFRYWSNNVYFNSADVAALSSVVQRACPRRIVEVGSGFSSACMLDINDRLFRGEIQFTFVEPYPERLRSLLRKGDSRNATVIESRLQDTSLEVFTSLEANDILFIDSSHVAKIGSDVNHLFFEILPRIKPGVYVHIHDVFWPFEYPKVWLEEGRAWNEQYLLRAFLQGNLQFEIVLFGSLLESLDRLRFERYWPMVGERSAENLNIGSGSIWLRRKPLSV